MKHSNTLWIQIISVIIEISRKCFRSLENEQLVFLTNATGEGKHMFRHEILCLLRPLQSYFKEITAVNICSELLKDWLLLNIVLIVFYPLNVLHKLKTFLDHKCLNTSTSYENNLCENIMQSN